MSDDDLVIMRELLAAEEARGDTLRSALAATERAIEAACASLRSELREVPALGESVISSAVVLLRELNAIKEENANLRQHVCDLVFEIESSDPARLPLEMFQVAGWYELEGRPSPWLRAILEEESGSPLSGAALPKWGDDTDA